MLHASQTYDWLLNRVFSSVYFLYIYLKGCVVFLPSTVLFSRIATNMHPDTSDREDLASSWPGRLLGEIYVHQLQMCAEKIGHDRTINENIDISK